MTTKITLAVVEDRHISNRYAISHDMNTLIKWCMDRELEYRPETFITPNESWAKQFPYFRQSKNEDGPIIHIELVEVI